MITDKAEVQLIETSEIPPASAAWYFTFNLKAGWLIRVDTTDFSRVEVQLLPQFCDVIEAEAEPLHD